MKKRLSPISISNSAENLRTGILKTGKMFKNFFNNLRLRNEPSLKKFEKTVIFKVMGKIFLMSFFTLIA